MLMVPDWSFGGLEFWSFGVLEVWGFGVLEFWIFASTWEDGWCYQGTCPTRALQPPWKALWLKAPPANRARRIPRPRSPWVRVWLPQLSVDAARGLATWIVIGPSRSDPLDTIDFLLGVVVLPLASIAVVTTGGRAEEFAVRA